MGFPWVFVNAFHQAGCSGSLYSVNHYAVDVRLVESSAPLAEQLANMLREASALGLSVMMDLVISHTAVDSPLIGEHPEGFRRDEQGQIVQPGAKDGKRRVLWRDLAVVDNAGPDAEAPWDFRRRLTPHYAGDAIHLDPSDLLIAYEVKPDGHGTSIRAYPVGTVPWQPSARPLGRARVMEGGSGRGQATKHPGSRR